MVSVGAYHGALVAVIETPLLPLAARCPMPGRRNRQRALVCVGVRVWHHRCSTVILGGAVVAVGICRGISMARMLRCVSEWRGARVGDFGGQRRVCIKLFIMAEHATANFHFVIVACKTPIDHWSLRLRLGGAKTCAGIEAGR